MTNGFLGDCRFGLRNLRKDRRFTAIALSLIALGIGATTVAFTFLNAVLFRRLPYPDPARVVVIWDLARFPADGQRRWTPDNDHFRKWEQRSRTIETLAGWQRYDLILSGSGEPRSIIAGAVTPQFFRLLGARTRVGRTFSPQEDAPGRDQVVVLSHQVWQGVFGSDPAVVGRVVRVNGVPHTVIGVMDPSFRPALPGFPHAPGVYVTMSHTLRPARSGRMFTFFTAAGRLRPGIALAQARADMEAVAKGIETEDSARSLTQGIELVPLTSEISRDARPALFALAGAVGCVLLICCVNLSSLLLARAAKREAEICVRAALGARPGRLIRQLLTESGLLSVAGGGAGLLLAYWLVQGVLLVIPADALPRVDEIVVDGRVLVFGLVSSVGCAMIFGVAPALRVCRPDPMGLTKATRAAGTNVKWRRFSNGLVITEIAVAMVLLTSAGLLIRTLVALREIDLGFHADGVLTVGINLPEIKYPNPAKRGEFIEELVERARRIPGVAAVAATNSIPISPGSYVTLGGIEIEKATDQAKAGYRTATPGYFEIMGIPLKAGRLFGPSDFRAHTIIINEAFANRYWPGSARQTFPQIGARVRISDVWRTVVGIVGNVRSYGRTSEAEPEVYLPHSENPYGSLELVLRAARRSPEVLQALRSVVYSIDPDQPIERVATIEEVISTELSVPRFHTLVSAAFGGIALLLATFGVYGVTSYAVAQRAKEIAICVAIGAAPHDVFRAVLVRTLRLVLAGVFLGAASSVIVTRYVSSLLFGVRPIDPLTFSAMGALIVLTGVLAALIPARQAMKTDPMTMLRNV